MDRVTKIIFLIIFAPVWLPFVLAALVVVVISGQFTRGK